VENDILGNNVSPGKWISDIASLGSDIVMLGGNVANVIAPGTGEVETATGTVLGALSLVGAALTPSSANAATEENLVQNSVLDELKDANSAISLEMAGATNTNLISTLNATSVALDQLESSCTVSGGAFTGSLTGAENAISTYSDPVGNVISAVDPSPTNVSLNVGSGGTFFLTTPNSSVPDISGTLAGNTDGSQFNFSVTGNQGTLGPNAVLNTNESCTINGGTIDNTIQNDTAAGMVENTQTITNGVTGGETVAVSGDGALVAAVDATVTLAANTQATVDGSTDSLVAGNDVALNLNGSGDTAVLGTGTSIQAIGGGNDITAVSSDSITIGGTSGSADIIDASGEETGAPVVGPAAAGIYLENGATATVNGSNNDLAVANDVLLDLNGSGDTAVLGTGTSIDAIGGGDDITAVSSDSITIGGTNGSADIIDASGEEIGNNVVGTTPAGIYLQNDAQATVNGNSDSLAAGNNDALTLFGNGDATQLGTGTSLNETGGGNDITAGSADAIVLGGTGGTADIVTASGEVAGGQTADGQGTGIELLNGATATINGSSDDTFDGTNVTSTLNGTADIVNMSGGDTATINGSGELVTGDVAGDIANLDSNTSVTITGTGGQFQVEGTGVTVGASGEIGSSVNDASLSLSGNNDTMTLGAGSSLLLFAGDQSDSISLSGGTVAMQNNDGNTTIAGSNDSLVLGSGDTATLIGSNDTASAGENSLVNFYNSADQETETLSNGVDGSTETLYFPAGNFEATEKITYSGENASGSEESALVDDTNGLSFLTIYDWQNNQSWGKEVNFYDQENGQGDEVGQYTDLDSGRSIVVADIEGTEEFQDFSQWDGDGTETASGFGNGGTPLIGDANSDNASDGNIDNPEYSDDDFDDDDDPVILNLKGQTVQTTALTGSTTYFDMQNNGQKVQTGWATAGEGILVYDPTGKDSVAQDSDLVAGFSMLDSLDSNHDGVLNASDAGWSDIKVWVDQNGSGNSTPDSLYSMAQLGITSINLNALAVAQNSNGNTILADSTFTFADGTTGDIAGVDLVSNPSAVEPQTSASDANLNSLVQAMSAIAPSASVGSTSLTHEAFIPHTVISSSVHHN
jgi:trimeric autotransporter adhesin